jgi:hypothetical protein
MLVTVGCQDGRIVGAGADAGPAASPDGGPAASPDAGPAPSPDGCAPLTCAAQGASCGSVSDGCGGTLACGTCAAPEVCVANVCGCTPTTCTAAGKNCGTTPDGCNGTLSCGTCPDPQVCGGGSPGVANVCGEGPCTTETTCEAAGKNCDSISDGCGSTLECGTCTAPETCGGGGVANVCGCAPTTCAAQGKDCGSISDGCDGTLDCGTCDEPATCGGAGTANVCGQAACPPTTCAAEGKNCGSIVNGCGGWLDCGATCPSPQTCGGGGVPNVCGGGSAATYTLPADRATAWNPGVTYGGGGIPSRTQICATVSPGAGDSTNAIQSAIDGCPAGQVVQLAAGTFTCNSYLLIDKGITLRGAGAGQTLIRKTNGATPNHDSCQSSTEPNLIIGPNRWPWLDDATAKNLTADGAKGATSVTVTSASGFAAGQFVLVDELSQASFRPDPLGRGQIYASADWRTVWQYHSPGLGIDDPVGDGAEGWFSRPYRVTSEIKEIASVAGNTITFTTPLHISYRVANVAQVTGYGVNQHVKGAGVEGISFSGGCDGGVRFETAALSWARNIEVTTWLGEGVSFGNSFRCELRDSYIHDGAWPVPGGGGYCLSLAGGASEILIENSISMMADKVMVARCSGAGSVVGYNYMDDGFIGGIAGWVEIGINASHMVGPHHVLFEGNYAFNFDSDKTHGSSIYHTVFRNWLTGFRRPFADPLNGGATQDDLSDANTGPKRCAGAGAYSYWMSFVGNVLGAAGKMGGFIYDSTGPGGMENATIWLLGWDDVSPYPYDPQVAATAVRDGNYDFVTDQQQWITSAPATLPDSLYLAGKPAFFGANPWPWVDPVTGVTFTLPAKKRFDDGTPNSAP